MSRDTYSRDPSNDDGDVDGHGSDDVDWPQHLMPSATSRRGHYRGGGGGDGGGSSGGSVRRGGWEGEEMEMEHQRSHKNDHQHTHAAVDLNQFRNTVVGAGYQAKHVVRQRTAASSSDLPVSRGTAAATTTTTTGLPSTLETDAGYPTKKSNKAGGAVAAESFAGAVDVSDLQALLLRNDGLRKFVKDVNDILSSPS